MDEEIVICYCKKFILKKKTRWPGARGNSINAHELRRKLHVNERDAALVD
jgi:hypothetical protein